MKRIVLTKSDKVCVDNIYNVVEQIRKETGRADFNVELDDDGWRLVGKYPDGSVASVGGLGVVPNTRQFYDRLYGFLSGICYTKRHNK